MTLRTDDYEIAAFFALIVVFELCERFRPAHPLNRWADLKLDVLSFAFALTVNRICCHWIRNYAGGLSLELQAWGAPLAYLRALPGVAKIALALFIVDFIIYWIHRAQHRFELLWRTHAWHHSIEHMYWFAGFRTSFFHSFIYNIPQVLIPVTLLNLSPAEAGIGYSLGLLIQFWEHTNTRVNIGILTWLLVTPAYHRLHHSATTHRGMNLGTTFTLWDRLFGTYVDPASVPAGYALGLGERVPDEKIPRMLLGV
jgi:sterol desaturase/sphingolipid hydroxylase (fatty acid hydroxylase superfamily)